MAWTYATWMGQNNDWALLASVNDFIHAALERQAVTGNLPNPANNYTETPKVVGDDVQTYLWIGRIQGWIANPDVYGRFVVSHAAGVKHPVSYYDNAAVIPAYFSLAELFSAAGLATSTWRAYTTHPDEGGINQARTIAPGDIIGPWLFEDLQKCLNALVWQRVYYYPRIGQATPVFRGGRGYYQPTWAAAKALAEATWPGVQEPSDFPIVFTYGYIYVPYPDYDADAFRNSYHITALAPWDNWASFSKEMRWMAVATKVTDGVDENIFDANGENLADGEWRCWLVDNPAAPGVVCYSSVRLGESAGIGVPVWVDEPTEALQKRRRGYKILVQDLVPQYRALIRWDVTGGFAYT